MLSHMKWLCLLFLPLAAMAQAPESPEAVYARLHAATLAANADAAIALSTAQRRAELASRSREERDGVFKLMQATIPKRYMVSGTQVAPDGRSAVLRATGMSDFMGKSQMYAEVRFLLEQGAWRVDTWGWSSDRPGGPLAAPAAVAPGRVEPPASRPVPQSVVPPRAPARPDDCVIKPVMTAEDMARCGR